MSYKENLVAGVDEVGRGPLAGPVVAGAVILPEKHEIEGLMDSKKLTKKKREMLYPIIIAKALGTGIGIVSAQKIDEINIREATFLAMERALGNLPKVPHSALIDGESLKSQIIPNKGIVKGDDKIDSIKAASIIAKVTRDKIMFHYGKIFPEYGFERNSGYGTKVHMEALHKYKSTPIHRRTFSPVKKEMPTIKWLQENNRIQWMCEKLAALYLMENNFEIKKINHNNFSDDRLNIFAISPDNQIVLFKVVQKSFAGDKKEVMHIMKKNELLTKISLSGLLDDHEIENIVPRVDALTVELIKNKSPRIKHFKGIINC
mgnify:CR=1 FL=1